MTESEFDENVNIAWRNDLPQRSDFCYVSMTCTVSGGIDRAMPEEAREYLEEHLKRKLHDFMLKEFGGKGLNELKKVYMRGYSDGLTGRDFNPEKAVM